MIKIQDLTFSYGQKQLFHNFNLEVPSDQFVAIIGPNGCGKSTLLKLISYEINNQQGELLIEGKALRDYSTKELALTLAYNRQHVEGIFPFTCLDYVMMGRRPHKQDFEDYSMEDYLKVEAYMKETDTLEFLEKKLTDISGGERQRVSLAKHLVQETPYLLLDESFSAMDIHHKLKSLRLLKEMSSSKKLIVCVMHDLNLVYQYSDYVIVLDKGRLIDHGQTKNVLTEELIHHVFGIHVEHIPEKGFIFC